MIMIVSDFTVFLLLAYLTFQVVECLKTIRGNNRGKELCFSIIKKLLRWKPILNHKEVFFEIEFPEAQVFFYFSKEETAFATSKCHQVNKKNEDVM
jgi:hypothetical protein